METQLERIRKILSPLDDDAILLSESGLAQLALDRITFLESLIKTALDRISGLGEREDKENHRYYCVLCDKEIDTSKFKPFQFSHEWHCKHRTLYDGLIQYKERP